MDNIIISLESATVTMKAKKYLTSKGYKATIEKSVDKGRSGCKSNLRVNGQKQKICRELAEIGIICR